MKTQVQGNRATSALANAGKLYPSSHTVQESKVIHTRSEKNIIFELDLPTGQIIFHQTSSWAKILDKKIEIPYDYPELAEHCINRFVAPEYKAVFSGTLALSSLRNAHMQKQTLQVLEGLLFNVETNAYEWYHINLLISINGKCFGTIQNMQEEKQREAMLQHSASHDALTDLYNRDGFYRSVNALMSDAACSGAFFILDIDNFKTINDLSGHQRGDEVIADLAQLLQELFPPNTVLGRFGGDEFTVFVPGSSNPDTFWELAVALCTAAEHRWKNIGITISVGISHYPGQANTLETLFDLADRALYHVKNNGKNGCAVFDPSMPELLPCIHNTTRTNKQARKKGIVSINWRRFAGIAAALTLMLTTLGLLTRIYSTSLQTMVQSESAEYLKEISQQIGGNITDKLGTTLSYLEAMGDLLPRGSQFTMQELSSLLDQQCQKLGIDSLIAIDRHGIEYQGDRPIYHAPLQEHIARVLLDRESFMTDTLHIEGMDYVLFFVPISPLTIEDIHISALVAFVKMDSMNEMLGLSAFDNAAFAEIVNINGAVVVRSGHADSLLNGYNLFTCLARETFAGGYNVTRLEEDFRSGNNGVTRYVQDGKEFVSYYAKLENSDWMLYCTTPAEILESKSSVFTRITVYACSAVAILIAGLMSGILLLQEHAKRQLTVVAYTDRVTLGANREKFVKDLQAFLPRANSPSIMLYTNVEHFKLINDRFGSDEADKLLRHIFQVFDEDLQAEEFVSRISGDHYALLLQDLPDRFLEDRIRVWNRKISLYPALLDAGFAITITYGAYRIEDVNLSVDVMIDRANMARKDGSAQRAGACVDFYDSSLQESMQRELELENAMESALANGEFLMYLQPKCLSHDGSVAGFEALARWLRLDGTLIPPDHFIPLFERNGFVIHLDHYIFERACQILKEQLDQGLSPVPISVNVSRAHLMGQDLLSPYLQIWERYHVPPTLLEFEFTESTIYDNIELLQQVVERIHQAGFTCSIDDFGAGYSSLNMLNLTNVDIVKIDRGFLGTDPNISERSRNIIQSVIQLAHKVGMRVVAEGVETRLQADFLCECGCDYFQGFYFGRPLPAQEALLHTNQILPKG